MASFSRKTILLTAVLTLTPFIGQAKSDTIAVRVSATSDDAEQNLNDGSIDSLDSSDLEFGFENIPDDGEGGQFVGMLFQGVAIPAGSTIDSAFIQFTVDEDDKGPAAIPAPCH